MTSLSRRILTQVFGQEFVSSLESISDQTTTSPENVSSEGRTEENSIETPSLTNNEMEVSRDLVHASPAKSHLVTGNHPQTTTTILMANNSTPDGPSKPKTPRRTSDPSSVEH